MLNYALHATTMNRDRDPAAVGGVDYAAFDDGASAPDAAGVGRGVATDGGDHGD